jgi:hypothetical protein
MQTTEVKARMFFDGPNFQGTTPALKFSAKGQLDPAIGHALFDLAKKDVVITIKLSEQQDIEDMEREQLSIDGAVNLTEDELDKVISFMIGTNHPLELALNKALSVSLDGKTASQYLTSSSHSRIFANVQECDCGFWKHRGGACQIEGCVHYAEPAEPPVLCKTCAAADDCKQHQDGVEKFICAEYIQVEDRTACHELCDSCGSRFVCQTEARKSPEPVEECGDFVPDDDFEPEPASLCVSCEKQFECPIEAFGRPEHVKAGECIHYEEHKLRNQEESAETPLEADSDAEGLTTPENTAEPDFSQPAQSEGDSGSEAEEAETSGTISWEQAMTQASGKAAADRILAAMGDVIITKLENTPFSDTQAQLVLTQKSMDKIVNHFVGIDSDKAVSLKRFLDDCYKANAVYFEKWNSAEAED